MVGGAMAGVAQARWYGMTMSAELIGLGDLLSVGAVLPGHMPLDRAREAL
jgi:hypothetical protein